MKHHICTRSYTTTNGLVSAVIFCITAVTYLVRRDDAQWRARVPYEVSFFSCVSCSYVFMTPE